MFMQTIIACLRFLGILLLRVLLGFVVGYLWGCAVAYLFHIIMDVRMPRDLFDHFYDSGPPREGRYSGRAAEVYGLLGKLDSKVSGYGLLLVFSGVFCKVGWICGDY